MPLSCPDVQHHHRLKPCSGPLRPLVSRPNLVTSGSRAARWRRRSAALMSRAARSIGRRSISARDRRAAAACVPCSAVCAPVLVRAKCSAAWICCRSLAFVVLTSRTGPSTVSPVTASRALAVARVRPRSARSRSSARTNYSRASSRLSATTCRWFASRPRVMPT